MSCTSISVVIAWVNPLELLRPGLDALARQVGEPAQMVVVTRHDAATRQRLRREYPGVTLLAAPPDTPITRLRSIGMQHARGDVIAVTEDHCAPCATWLSSIRQRIDAGADVVGGPVENAATRRLRDRAAFLTEYAWATPPVADGESMSLPGNNIAYRRELVPVLQSALDEGRWESFCYPELARRGARMVCDPAMLVHHRRPFGFRYFVAQRFHFSRSFAAMRSQSFGRSLRAAYGVGSVLLPPLLVARGLRAVQRKGRLDSDYVSSLPLISVYIVVGAVGEMVGYLAGGGNSLKRVE